MYSDWLRKNFNQLEDRKNCTSKIYVFWFKLFFELLKRQHNINRIEIERFNC